MIRSGIVFLFTAIIAASAFADIKPMWDEKSKVCPAPSATERYIDVPVFYDLDAINASQKIPGLKTYSEYAKEAEGMQMRIYFELMAPFDPSKKTVIFIPGGPGQDHSFIHRVWPLLDKASNIGKQFNVLAMDHRGTGCSRQLAPGSEPYEALLMRYAASDIDSIRKQLLGENGKIYVWGGSYGTMLAQTYALLYPESIERLILWGAYSEAHDFTDAQNAFIPRVLEHIPLLKAEFPDFQKQNPELATKFMQMAAGRWYSFEGRDSLIAQDFNSLKNAIAAKDSTELKRVLNYDSLGVMQWMMRSIACTEVFNWQELQQVPFQMFPGVGKYCEEFKGKEEFFNYTSLISGIKIPTFIHAGKYDHVTPLVAQERMHKSIPNSYLFVDQHSGHGVDKPYCFAKITEGFLTAANHQELDAMAASTECTTAPTLPVH